MDITAEEIEGLIERPSEGLNTEIKRWIDPASPEGMAKIIKAIFALYNRNGGFLLVGYDDCTLRPDTANMPPADVRRAFHTDEIQGLVSRFASQGFEIGVGFGTRDGVDYPIIKVAEGVRSPIAVKRDLRNGGGGHLLREGEVYFRTLASNGTPSSATARPGDWPDIVEICFDNREADIGRFLRRQLAGKDAATLIEALTGMRSFVSPPPPTLRDRAFALLSDGENRFHAAIGGDNRLSDHSFLERGMWHVGLVIEPANATALPTLEFLNTALGANPQLTGWPIWLDSRGFSDRSSAPYVIDRAWQTLIVSLQHGWSRHIDFMRLDPRGEFFLQRVMQDDAVDAVPPGQVLDPILVLLRVAEAIVVALSMTKALGWNEDARLGMAFRWTKLAGRELSSWANPMASVPHGDNAHTDTIETFVEIPAETPISAIAPHVEEATRELFLTFGGCTVPPQAIEMWVKKLVERRL